MERKRLFFDIETSFCIGWFWRPGYKITIPYQNILKQAAIICIGYKWEGERETHIIKWDSKQSDKQLLIEFLKVAREADEIIGHNGDKFDLAWIRTRCAYHKLDMFPKYTTIDTLKVSRSKFRFPSNRLNDIADYLGLGQKIKSDSNWWVDITLNKDEKAMSNMVRYCKKDVRLLEDVYEHLKNHIEVKVNYPALYKDDRGGCPECGHDRLVISRSYTTATGMLKRQFRCSGCGKHHTKTIPRNKALK